MNIVIMGPQGSGKSTQADLLAAKINLPHVSTGAIFRELEKLPSELGQRIKSQYNTGGLISDEDTHAVLTQVLSDPKNSLGIILDGFPRNLGQAEHSPIKFDHVIYLRVSDETAVKRLLNRQREDDTLEMIQERLRVYHLQTEPILDYYRGLGILIEINGEPTQEEIFAEICQKLNLTA